MCLLDLCVNNVGGQDSGSLEWVHDGGWEQNDLLYWISIYMHANISNSDSICKQVHYSQPSRVQALRGGYCHTPCHQHLVTTSDTSNCLQSLWSSDLLYYSSLICSSLSDYIVLLSISVKLLCTLLFTIVFLYVSCLTLSLFVHLTLISSFALL